VESRRHGAGDHRARREEDDGLQVPCIVEGQHDLGAVIGSPAVRHDFEDEASTDGKADVFYETRDVVRNHARNHHFTLGIGNGPLAISSESVPIVFDEFQLELEVRRTGGFCSDTICHQELRRRKAVLGIFAGLRPVGGEVAFSFIPGQVRNTIGFAGRGEQVRPELREVAVFRRAGHLAAVVRVDERDVSSGEEVVPPAVPTELGRGQADHAEETLVVLDAQVANGKSADVIRRGRCGRQDIVTSRISRPGEAIGQAPRVDAAGIDRNIHGNEVEEFGFEGHLRLLVGLGEDVHGAVCDQGTGKAEARVR